MVVGYQRDARRRLWDREQELAEVEGVLGRAGRREGGVLVVRGPAGIGKTALLIDARARALERDMLVLSARAAQFERAFAYGVVRQLFEPVLARRDLPDAELFAGAAAGARALFDDQPGTPLGIDTAFSILHSLYWLTANLAALAPLALIVDDVGWSDEASLRFVEFLVRRVSGMPVSLVVAFRTGDPDQPELLGALCADPLARVSQPASLSESAIGAVLEDELGELPDPGVCTACHRATGGNPLLVVELGRALAAENIGSHAEALERVRQIGAVAIGPTVQSRLAALGDQARTVARAIAVLGESPRQDDLMRMVPMAPQELDETIAALSSAHIVSSGERLSFVHPLFADAIRESLRGSERATLHGQAAEALMARGASARELAPHLMAGPPGAHPGAAAVLREAARWALSTGAPENAVSYLARALTELGDGTDHSELLLELGSAKAQIADSTARDELERAIELARDPQTAARARMTLARFMFATGDHARSLEVLEEGIGHVGESDRELGLRLEAQLLASIHAAGPELDSLPTPVGARMAQARAERASLNSPAGRLVLCCLAGEAVRGGRATDALALAIEALSRGDVVSNEGPESPPIYSAIGALVWCDELERAVSTLTAALAEARRRSSLFGFSATLSWRGYANLRMGRLLEAEADARAALDAVGEWRHGPVPALTGSVLAGSLTAQGRFEEARAVLNETPVPAAQSATFFALESRGRLSLAIGDYEQAAREFAHYDELDLRARNAVPARPETVGLIPHRSLWARALIACGEVAQAGELLETELSLARELGTHRAVGMALHVAGLLEHGEIQLRLLGEATETLAQSQSRLAYIDALCDHGAALRRANRRADARRPLTAALQIAREAHARPLQERAAQELKATGARVSRPHATGIEALTASEQRVASMAADGMSNRDIAQGLFVTIKTVETHLGHVYQKLDLSSRSQLSTALTDHSATA